MRKCVRDKHAQFAAHNFTEILTYITHVFNLSLTAHMAVKQSANKFFEN